MMADTSQQELPEPHSNGAIDGLTEDEKSKMRPADIDADMREMERRKRVEMMMNSRIFREELERIIETQMKDGAGPSGLLQQISDMMGVQGARFNSNIFKSSNCVVPINDIRGIESMGYAKGEKLLRCKLAAVFRLLDLYGWTQGVGGQITARLNQDHEHFLVNPYGLLYHEITASSLIKVDMQGCIVEQGTTNFGVLLTGFQLHSTIHAARPDIKCIIHITIPSVIAVSTMKCGLLPLTQESIVIGEVSMHQYVAGVSEPEEKEKITRNLGPLNKILFLTNRGALCCGETVEEAFYNVYNTVLACETQLKLIPAGIENLSLISEESRKSMFDFSRKSPMLSNSSINESSPLADKLEKRWRIGGTEFEALMRMLDNAGFRTGYIYKHPLVKGELPRPRNDVEVPPAVSSLGYLLEEEELYKQGLWKGGRKGTDRSRWLNSPNVYQKVEILETGTPDPKKITKWVTDGSPTHSSTPVRIESALQFVPKNTNPKEFKQLQQQIKDYRRADKISAGPQSHILEGVTWDEAKKMQDATISATGEQVVLVGAASKGIIQRGFQHNAMVYKTPYAKNPFDTITDQELDQYKKDVERKQKGDPYDESQSESEGLSSFNVSRATHESSTAKSLIQSPVSITSETEEESKDEPRVLRIETKKVPLPSQPEVVLSDEPPAPATLVESPTVQQAYAQSLQRQVHRQPPNINNHKTEADATSDFLNELRRTAGQPRDDNNIQDCQLGKRSSINSGQSYGWPTEYNSVHLEVNRSGIVSPLMIPRVTEISHAFKITRLDRTESNEPLLLHPKHRHTSQNECLSNYTHAISVANSNPNIIRHLTTNACNNDRSSSIALPYHNSQIANLNYSEIQTQPFEVLKVANAPLSTADICDAINEQLEQIDFLTITRTNRNVNRFDTTRASDRTVEYPESPVKCAERDAFRVESNERTFLIDTPDFRVLHANEVSATKYSNESPQDTVVDRVVQITSDAFIDDLTLVKNIDSPVSNAQICENSKTNLGNITTTLSEIGVDYLSKSYKVVPYKKESVIESEELIVPHWFDHNGNRSDVNGNLYGTSDEKPLKDCTRNDVRTFCSERIPDQRDTIVGHEHSALKAANNKEGHESQETLCENSNFQLLISERSVPAAIPDDQKMINRPIQHGVDIFGINSCDDEDVVFYVGNEERSNVSLERSVHNSEGKSSENQGTMSSRVEMNYLRQDNFQDDCQNDEKHSGEDECSSSICVIKDYRKQENFTEVRLLSNILPRGNVSHKYNLDPMKMTWMYSLTPTNNGSEYDRFSSADLSIKSLNVSYDKNHYAVDSIRDEKSDFIWVKFTEDANRKRTNVNLNRTVELSDKSPESLVDIGIISQESNKMKLPCSKDGGMEDTTAIVFVQGINETTNQIIAKLNCTREICNDAAICIVKLIDDESYLNIRCNRDPDTSAIERKKLQADDVAKFITDILIDQLPCYQVQSIGPKNLYKTSWDHKFPDEPIRPIERINETGKNSSNNVVIIDEIVHHIVDDIQAAQVTSSVNNDLGIHGCSDRFSDSVGYSNQIPLDPNIPSAKHTTSTKNSDLNINDCYDTDDAILEFRTILKSGNREGVEINFEIEHDLPKVEDFLPDVESDDLVGKISPKRSLRRHLSCENASWNELSEVVNTDGQFLKNAFSDSEFENFRRVEYFNNMTENTEARTIADEIHHCFTVSDRSDECMRCACSDEDTATYSSHLSPITEEVDRSLENCSCTQASYVHDSVANKESKRPDVLTDGQFRESPYTTDFYSRIDHTTATASQTMQRATENDLAKNKLSSHKAIADSTTQDCWACDSVGKSCIAHTCADTVHGNSSTENNMALSSDGLLDVTYTINASSHLNDSDISLIDELTSSSEFCNDMSCTEQCSNSTDYMADISGTSTSDDTNSSNVDVIEADSTETCMIYSYDTKDFMQLEQTLNTNINSQTNRCTVCGEEHLQS